MKPFAVSTRSRVDPVLLAMAMLATVGMALRETRVARSALHAQELAERELHASEAIFKTAKREATEAEQWNRPEQRAPMAPPLSGNALVSAQTIEALRSRPEIMAIAREAATCQIRSSYGSLIAQLGLTADQAAQLEALLLQRDGINFIALPLQSAGPKQQRATDVALKQLLGEAGYARFCDYTETLPVRTQIAEVAARLSQVEPLSVGVAEQLVQATAEKLQQYNRDFGKSGATDRYFPNEAMLPAARRLLSAQQFESFKLLVQYETGRKVD